MASSFGVPVIQPSALIRKNVFENQIFCMMKVFLLLKIVKILWVKLVPNYKISNLREALCFYRWHDSNISVTKNLSQQKYANEIAQKQVFQITEQRNHSAWLDLCKNRKNSRTLPMRSASPASTSFSSREHKVWGSPTKKQLISGWM